MKTKKKIKMGKENGKKDRKDIWRESLSVFVFKRYAPSPPLTLHVALLDPSNGKRGVGKDPNSLLTLTMS